MLHIDYITDFLDRVEGNVYTAYVPQTNGRAIANSGVTIGRGVDLGQQNPFYLRSLGINEDLLVKLSYYLGKSGDEALNSMRTKKLVLTNVEVDQLNQVIFLDYLKKIQKRWDKNSQRKFSTISKQEQAATVSLLYQYGIDSCPSTFGKLCQFQVKEAVSELLNPRAWGAKYYKSRREQEAALLMEIQNNRRLSLI